MLHSGRCYPLDVIKESTSQKYAGSANHIKWNFRCSHQCKTYDKQMGNIAKTMALYRQKSKSIKRQLYSSIIIVQVQGLGNKRTNETILECSRSGLWRQDVGTSRRDRVMNERIHEIVQTSTQKQLTKKCHNLWRVLEWGIQTHFNGILQVKI